MADKDQIIKEKLEHSGLFNFPALYRYAHEWYLSNVAKTTCERQTRTSRQRERRKYSKKTRQSTTQTHCRGAFK